MCSNIEWKDKLLIPKLDNLFKNVNKKKTWVGKLDIQIRKFYFFKNSQHVKNEAIFASMAKENVFHLVT